jgi:hypothetical protein
MPILYNDSAYSSSNFGTAYLPISGANITGSFLAENITITQPTSRIELRGAQNEPAGRIVQTEYEGGNATLQVSGNFPSLGSLFGFQGFVYYLDEVGKQFTQADVYKAQVSFARKYN